MKKSKKLFTRVIAVILSLALACFPVDTVKASADVEEAVKYLSPKLDANGSRVLFDEEGNVVFEELSCNDYTVVDENTTEWSAGWYVLQGWVELTDRIIVTGDVKLILCNGCELNAPAGICVNSNMVDGVEQNSLTIYAQSVDSSDMGILLAGDRYVTNLYEEHKLISEYAAIGGGCDGSDERNSGIITINGGEIYANSSPESAGIGGGYCGAGKNITINGGTVQAAVCPAAEGEGAAAIGGGDAGDGKNIIINGGIVDVKHHMGAGIGGGINGNGTDIYINGGTVNTRYYTLSEVLKLSGIAAYLGDYFDDSLTDCELLDNIINQMDNFEQIKDCLPFCGAGIGGGMVENTDSEEAAGIGTDIYINGGTVTSEVSELYNAIGNGPLYALNNIDMDSLIDNSDINNPKLNYAYLASVLSNGNSENIFISNSVVSVGESKAEAQKLPEKASGEYTAEDIEGASYISTRSYASYGTDEPEKYPSGNITYLCPEATENGVAFNADGTVKLDEKTCNEGEYAIVKKTTTEWTSGWYAVGGNVTINDRIKVSGHVNLILCDGCELNAVQGISVTGNIDEATGKEKNSLTIYAQSTGEKQGKLTAGSEDKNKHLVPEGAAAIGGECEKKDGGYADPSEACDSGIITINGGNLSIYGGGAAAGIGGGSLGKGKNITINSGLISSIGGDEGTLCGGAGIGGGSSGSGEHITINGGEVYAHGSGCCSGIGGGEEGNGEDITINGGLVYAYGAKEMYSCAGIGGGAGGYGKNISITGGTVYAYGSKYGAGIGGGERGTGENICISGGKVYAYAGEGAVAIGGGVLELDETNKVLSLAASKNISITNSIVKIGTSEESAVALTAETVTENELVNSIYVSVEPDPAKIPQKEEEQKNTDTNTSGTTETPGTSGTTTGTTETPGTSGTTTGTTETPGTSGTTTGTTETPGTSGTTTGTTETPGTSGSSTGTTTGTGSGTGTGTSTGTGSGTGTGTSTGTGSGTGSGTGTGSGIIPSGSGNGQGSKDTTTDTQSDKDTKDSKDSKSEKETDSDKKTDDTAKKDDEPKSEPLTKDELKTLVEETKEKASETFKDVTTYVAPVKNDASAPVEASKSKKGNTYFNPETKEVYRNTFIEVPVETKKDSQTVSDSTEGKDKETETSVQNTTVKFVGNDGKPVKNTVVTTVDSETGEENSYVTDKKGNVITNKVVTLSDGSRVFAKEDGTLAKNEMVKAKNGYTYYADENGQIAKKQVISSNGKKYYANGKGVIVKNKLVTDSNGKKHYATKNGSFAVNKWVTVGNTKYWCNKNGVITKTKKVTK